MGTAAGEEPRPQAGHDAGTPHRQDAIVPPVRSKQFPGERQTLADPQKNIEMLEMAFPAASGSAFADAREQALEAGLSVLESEGGVSYEVFPDGRRRAVYLAHSSARCRH